MTSRPDVIVIGAGLVGAAIADGLTDAGCGVTVLETAFAGGGSTGAAMGHLVVMDDSPAQMALCAHSRRRWEGWLDELPADIEADRCGTLWLAADADELAVAAGKIRHYQAHGVAAELLDESQLRGAEPALRIGLAGALRVPGDAVCYPPAVARHLLERAQRRGARVHAGTHVVAVAPGRVTVADGTEFTTGEIVVAAGPHSTALIPGLPVVPRRGHLVITERRPGLVHHQLVELGYLHSAHTMGGASVAFNVQPRRTGQLLVGSSRELVGFDGAINGPLLGRMIARAVAVVPALATLSVLRSWVGFRPATPDSLPLIGPWHPMPGVWIATGHEGLGITMAPGTADLIVAGITGGTAPLDARPYAPTRPMPVGGG